VLLRRKGDEYTQNNGAESEGFSDKDWSKIMEHPTDLVDAFERIKDLEKQLEVLEKQWDDLYEENLILRKRQERLND